MAYLPGQGHSGPVTPLSIAAWLSLFIPVGLAVLAAAISGFGDESPLAYRREEVLHGAWWQLLSSHFVHLNPRHLLVNIAAYGLIWFIFIRPRTLILWWAYLLGGGLGSGLGLLWLRPDVQWYVGLSGALHGLLLAAALESLRQERGLAVLLSVVLTIKLAWEHFAGSLPGMDQWLGAPVVSAAHLYGALGILPVWAALKLMRARRSHSI